MIRYYGLELTKLDYIRTKAHFCCSCNREYLVQLFGNIINLFVFKDEDATSDPPLSTSGTIRISGDPQFEFPEEPVFSQTLYFATYTDGHQLILPEPITLQQGLDENVIFDLDGGMKSCKISVTT